MRRGSTTAATSSKANRAPGRVGHAATRSVVENRLTDANAVASFFGSERRQMSGFVPSVLVASAEPLLVAVAGVLALVIVGLVALALVVRRRTSVPPPRAAEEPVLAPVAAAPAPQPPRPRIRPHHARGGGGAGLAMATSSAMVCPTCRTEYHGMAYCTRDARRLVLPEEMLGGPLRALQTGQRSRVLGTSAGLVCMACRRAYEPGLRNCPHDGNELVPFPVYNATRPRSKKHTTEPTGVIARICPVCATKYDLNARFCGHDAGELVVIN
jgi:hypothetical protein